MIRRRKSLRIDEGSIDWTHATVDNCATQIQAGYKGMKAREEIIIEELEMKKIIEKKNRELEEHLGIDLADPEVIKATTTIQVTLMSIKVIEGKCTIF